MKWTIEEMTGYTPKTTFWEDFTIADRFGIDAIKNTYKRAFNEWKNDYIYLTELVMVLNWKLWYWYERDEKIATLYNDLWSEADKYAIENLKGKDLEYFYETTD